MENKNTNYTIHIFGYGETQINSDYSFKDATNGFTNVVPLVDAIWENKPEDSLLTEKKYHVIHIFNGSDIRWVSENGFSLSKEEIDESLLGLIENLKVEFKEKYDDKILADSQIQAQTQA
jgi:hypothetical protein